MRISLYVYIYSEIDVYCARPHKRSWNPNLHLFPTAQTPHEVRMKKAAKPNESPRASSPSAKLPELPKEIKWHKHFPYPPHFQWALSHSAIGTWSLMEGILMLSHGSTFAGKWKDSYQAAGRKLPWNLHAEIMQFPFIKIYIFWQEARFVACSFRALRSQPLQSVAGIGSLLKNLQFII